MVRIKNRRFAPPWVKIGVVRQSRNEASAADHEALGDEISAPRSTVRSTQDRCGEDPSQSSRIGSRSNDPEVGLRGRPGDPRAPRPDSHVAGPRLSTRLSRLLPEADRRVRRSARVVVQSRVSNPSPRSSRVRRPITKLHRKTRSHGVTRTPCSQRAAKWAVIGGNSWMLVESGITVTTCR